MIYLLEDDDSIRKLVIYALESQGFNAVGYAEPKAFWDGIAEAVPDLLLLDIMLPGEDGISILKKLRRDARTRDLPVIMLTAKNTEFERVEGLDSGADDYISKPFRPRELVSRIRSVLRRSGRAQSVVTIDNVTVDMDRGTVAKNGGEVALSALEYVSYIEEMRR